MSPWTVIYRYVHTDDYARDIQCSIRGSGTSGRPDGYGTALGRARSRADCVKWRRNFSCFLGRSICCCCFSICVYFVKRHCAQESEEGWCVNCCLRTYQSSCRSFYLKKKKNKKWTKVAVLPISISISRSSDAGVLFR